MVFYKKKNMHFLCTEFENLAASRISVQNTWTSKLIYLIIFHKLKVHQPQAQENITFQRKSQD